jgi:osmotically-inducible protein OsmY
MASDETASPSGGTLRKITDELGITEPEAGRDSALQGSAADDAASDTRLREEVCEHLWRGAHVDVSEVSVEVRQGIVMLEGSVPNREMKYAIEDIVASCHGVRDVENRIRVMSGD